MKLPRIEDAVKAGGFLTGTPDDIIEQLKALEKRYPGLSRVTVAQPLGLPLSMCLEQLEWFAQGRDAGVQGREGCRASDGELMAAD